MCYSRKTAYASAALSILTVIYDELGYAAGHWFGRNLLNALGFVTFEVGACLIAGEQGILPPNTPLTPSL